MAKELVLLTLLAFLLWVWAYPREAYFWYEDLTGAIIYD